MAVRLSGQAVRRALHGGPAVAGAALGAVILIAGEAWLWSGQSSDAAGAAVADSTARAATAAAAAAVAVLAGWLVGNAYAQDRYRDSPPLPVVYAWAQRIHHARIGIIGLPNQYPLTGSKASNCVQYIGVARPHGGFAPAATCRQWRTAVNRGRYRFVVVARRR